MNHIRIGFALLFLVPALAFAKGQRWEQVEPKDYQEFISDYPEMGTPESNNDYTTLIELQNTRHPEECEFGDYLKWTTFEAMFSKKKPDHLNDAFLPVKFAPLLTDEEVAQSKKLLNKAMKLSEEITKYYKNKYLRSRPSRVDSRIQPCNEVPEGAKSYPSSHAAKGALLGCLLSFKFQKEGDGSRAQALSEYGDYLGKLRAIGGVHHPTDVAAGHALAYALCENLLDDKHFVELLLGGKDGSPE